MSCWRKSGALGSRSAPRNDKASVMKSSREVVLAAVVALACPELAAQSYDLLLRHGRVADGTGNPSFFANVAIKDGRIAAIGKIDTAAKAQIDARGLTIAPGFIDVHTHAEDIDELPLAENFVRMGVTTVVLGNCGSSVLRVGEFFRRLEA